MRREISSSLAVRRTAEWLRARSAGAQRRSRPPVQAPVIDRQAASATLISGYLENLQRLVQSAPAEQAEIAAAAQREYDMAPHAEPSAAARAGARNTQSRRHRPAARTALAA